MKQGKRIGKVNRAALALTAFVLLLASLLGACGGNAGGGATTTAAAATTTAAATTAAATTAAATTTAATTTAAAAGGLSGVNEFPISAETLEMSVFCAPNALVESMENNEFTKWYQEKTNVKINWQTVPQQARAERLNLMLASDDLPDVIFGAGVTKDDEMVYGPQGKFLDLTPYIEKHGYYIKEMYDAVPYIEAGITAADGKKYSLPQVNECFHCMYGSGRGWINNTIRKELGLETPTNLDEFRDYLLELKKNGYVPISGNKPDPINNLNGLVVYLTNSFVYTDADQALYIEDGTVKASYVQPEFKEALKYINGLYKEGLIDPATFTQTGDDLRQIVESDDGNKLGFAQVWWFGSLGSLEGEEHKSFDVLSPMKGPNGAQFTVYSPYTFSTGQYVVTYKSKNPDLAVKWADYLFSDDAAVRYIECGRPGIEWREATADEKDFYSRPAKRARIDVEGSAYSEQTNVHYYQMGPSYRSFDYRESWYRGGDTEEDMYGRDGYEWRLHEYTMTQTSYRPDMVHIRVYPPVYTTEADSRELKRITSNIKDYRMNFVDAFVTGQRDIDAEWDSYVKGFDGLELSLYLEIKQRGYDNSTYKNSIPEPGNPEAPVKFAESVNK